MFKWDYFLNKWLYRFMKWHCLLNECLSYLWIVFVASLAIYYYWTVTTTVTEISVGSHVWNHYCLLIRWPSTDCSVCLDILYWFAIGCTTNDYYSFWMTVMAWIMSHKMNDWYTDKWPFSILKGHSFLASLRICYSLVFHLLFIYICRCSGTGPELGAAD